jgi:hypothetical protein
MKAIGEPSRQSYAPLDVGYPSRKEHFIKKYTYKKEENPYKKNRLHDYGPLALSKESSSMQKLYKKVMALDSSLQTLFGEKVLTQCIKEFQHDFPGNTAYQSYCLVRRLAEVRKRCEVIQDTYRTQIRSKKPRKQPYHLPPLAQPLQAALQEKESKILSTKRKYNGEILPPIKKRIEPTVYSQIEDPLITELKRSSPQSIQAKLSTIKSSIRSKTDPTIKKEAYDTLLARLSELGDYRDTLDLIPEISLLAKQIKKESIQLHVKLHTRCQQALNHLKQNCWKHGRPLLPLSNAKGFHNVYIIESKIVFKIGEEVAATEKAMYGLSLLMGMEGVVPAAKSGAMDYVQVKQKEDVFAGGRLAKSYAANAMIRNVKGMLQVFQKGCYFGASSAPFMNWSSTQKNEFYSRIDPLSFWKASLFSILIAHGDLRIGHLKSSNILFQPQEKDQRTLDCIVIDMEISMSESNKESSFRKKVFGNQNVVPYRSSLLAFPQADKAPSEDILTQVKTMVLGINERDLIDFLKKQQFSYETKQPYQKEKILKRQLYNRLQIDAFRARLQLLKDIVARKRSFTLRDVVYAVFPDYAYADRILEAKGYGVEMRSLMVGLLPNTEIRNYRYNRV